MGNKLKQSGLFSKTAMSHIGTVSICPNCQQSFPPTTTYESFDQHVTQCLENFRPSDQERLRMQRRKKSKDSTGSKGSEGEEDAHDYVTIQVYVKKIQNMELQKATVEKEKTRKTFKNDAVQKKGKKTYFWIKSHLTYSESLLNSLKLQEIRQQGSAYKMLWLHQKLSALRVTWKKGSEMLTFHPETIIRDSLALRNLNPYKELKIAVINDVVHDAGGLLRQWATMLLKQLITEFKLFVSNKEGFYILNPQLSSLEKLNSKIPQKQPQKQLKQPEQTAKTLSETPKRHSQMQQQFELYKELYFNNIENEQEWQDEDQDQDYNEYGSYFMNQQGQQSRPAYIDYSKVTYRELYELFACLIGKIVIEKVTIPVAFDWVFLGALIGKGEGEIVEDRLETYDRQIYESVVYLKQLSSHLKSSQSPNYAEKLEQLKSLGLTFTTPSSEYIPEHELIPNGKNVFVETPEQLAKYIEKVNQYYFHVLHRNQLKIIKQKFYSIIKPEHFDGLFHCQQLQLLINGVNGENINVKDWQEGTEYKEPYNKDHKVIKYFWATVEKMNAEEKMRLLKFVTGSERLPVYGFKNLQTNRGQTSHFVIESTKYDKKVSCLPKAHTCFNRLVLPLYPSESVLSECLLAVIRGNFDGVWGME